MNWLIAVIAVLFVVTMIVLGDKIFDDVVERLLTAAKRTPYFHLHHADNSLYMERYWIVPFASAKEGCFVATWRQPVFWLLQKLGISIRLHVIHTPDLDRALHDHPWTFARWVLRGWYIEERPVAPEKAEFQKFADPMVVPLPEHPMTMAQAERYVNPPLLLIEREPVVRTRCEVGSFALRRFFHRHRISAVSPGGVVTLFISWSKRQSWGFYTPQGKVWWWVFESVHNTKPITAVNPLRGTSDHTPDLYVGD